MSFRFLRIEARRLFLQMSAVVNQSDDNAEIDDCGETDAIGIEKFENISAHQEMRVSQDGRKTHQNREHIFPSENQYVKDDHDVREEKVPFVHMGKDERADQRKQCRDVDEIFICNLDFIVIQRHDCDPEDEQGEEHSRAGVDSVDQSVEFEKSVHGTGAVIRVDVE